MLTHKRLLLATFYQVQRSIARVIEGQTVIVQQLEAQRHHMALDFGTARIKAEQDERLAAIAEELRHLRMVR